MNYSIRVESFTNGANVTNLILKKLLKIGWNPLGCFLLTTGFVFALETNSGYPRLGA